MTTSVTTRRLVFMFSLLAASVASMANSAEPKAGNIIKNSIEMRLAYIPRGEFEMGSPESEKDRRDREGEKLHHVKLTKGFYLGAYEVTQSQFKKVLGRNPAWFSKDGDGKSKVAGKDTASFPVEQVSWYDAVEFCNALSKSEGLPEYYTLIRDDKKNKASAEVVEGGGKGYRLPTEAEWEYACRAGTETPFHFGDELNGKDANVDGEFPYGTSTKGPSLNRTREVGGYAPNKFGLYDMHGNVWEWCNDWYGDYAGDRVDPKGPAVSVDCRVLRGGAFSHAHEARSASRLFYQPTYRSGNFGFRVAMTHP